MARIFTIRFSLRDTFHDALVNVVDCASVLEYHLKAADEIVDNVIKDCNIFQLERNRFTLKKKPSNKEAAIILESMMHAIVEYESKRLPVVSLIV